MNINSYKYIGTGANQVVSAKPIVLKRVTIGKDVASSIVEISDDVADGDGNVMIKLEGSTLSGTWDFDLKMKKGCTLDVTNQTNITIEYVNI